MVVNFDVKVKGIKYSESLKIVSKLEEDGIIEFDDDVRDMDNNDIGQLSGGKNQMESPLAVIWGLMLLMSLNLVDIGTGRGYNLVTM